MNTRHTMSRHTTLAVASLALVLQACADGDRDYDFDTSRETFEAEQAQAAADANAAQFLFDPSAGEIPFPNDLLFGGSVDGTLNIPVTLDAEGNPANPSDPTIALNQLDGFSTVAPASASASEALDPATVALGASVFVLSLGADGTPTPLDASQVAVQAIDNQVVLVPVQPLQSNTRYLVLLTNSIIGADGEPLEASLFYDLAKGDTPYEAGLAAFEPVRQQVAQHLQIAAAVGLSADDVVLSWTFKTQSIREPLQAASDLVAPSTLLLAPTGLTTSDANAALQGKADLYIGTLDLPYYLGVADASDPASIGAALSSFWQNASGSPVNPLDWTPVGTTITVPVLMTVPNTAAAGGGATPADGWPVTVFQHGITGNRSQALAVADGMADAGRIVIAIDQPLHGITDSSSALYAGSTPFPTDQERTFDIDIVTEVTNEDGSVTTTDGPDGNIDSSGRVYFNLTDLANTRGNLRQSAADLMTLSQSIGGMLLIGPDGNPAPAASLGLPLNTGNKSFLGHSLGGITGTVALSYDTSFQAATLAMPGGGLPYLLANSASFGPTVIDGLADAGIEAGSADFQQYLVAAQSAVDSGDPINHASTLAADASTGIHLIQVEGDLVIPNAVATAPLAGTAPMARVMQLPQVDGSVASNRVYVRFSAGDHGSILRPSDGSADGIGATVEMQTQTASFAATQGQQLPIANTAVILPVASE